MSLTSSRPIVTLKLATSLDGRIALADGRSKWITGPDSRAEVHKLRAAHDAILTGIGTVLADDPQMTARPAGGDSVSQPLRVVLDSQLRTPPSAKILEDDGALILFVSPSSERVEALEQRNARCLQLASESSGRVDMGSALTVLSDEGVGSVMIEAGGAVAGAAIQAGCVDRIEWFRAPMLLGADAQPCISGLALESLDLAPMFHRTSAAPCGADLWERYERIGP